MEMHFLSMLTTHIIIPAVNVDSRFAELHYVNEWALANNLKLNLTKSQEIIFTDQRRKTKFSIPDKIPLLQLVQTTKILGITFTSSLSVTLHVQSVMAACAQTLYAPCVLRRHGLCDDSLHDIFRAVAVEKNVCIQRLVGILQRQRHTEDLSFHSSLRSHWFLFSRSSWLPRPSHFFGWETI